MNQSAQDHFDTIINALLPLALEMITRSGTFLPFGGFINKDDDFEQLTVEHNGSVEPKDLVTMFRRVLEQGAKQDGYKAFGICAHMRAALPGQSEKQDLVVTSMEDESGIAVDSYLPYEKNADGEILPASLVSEIVAPTVFSKL